MVDQHEVLVLSSQLVDDFKAGDTRVVNILNNLDFYILPSLNVDGYAYTFSDVSSVSLLKRTRTIQAYTRKSIIFKAILERKKVL